MLKIVSAAVLCLHPAHPTLVIVGLHHWDAVMTNAVDHMPGYIHPVACDWRCGFLTSESKFVTRREAWKIASEAGQIVNVAQGYSEKILHSENLY